MNELFINALLNNYPVDFRSRDDAVRFAEGICNDVKDAMPPRAAIVKALDRITEINEAWDDFVITELENAFCNNGD